MNRESKIFVAGATGLVGSAITRKLLENGYRNITGSYLTRDPGIMFSDYGGYLRDGSLRFVKVDLTDRNETESFFMEFRPEYVFLSAAKVGGIWANNVYRADFIYQNLQIQTNVIHLSYKYGVKKLLFLGSTCIYPKLCPQPMKEDYLLTGPLEYTNEPYAVAKIAGLKMCESYNLQYGTNFISVMPTNLYGYWDNFDLETSHVIPALMRKMHLAKLLENNDIEGIRKDLEMYPFSRGTGDGYEVDVLKIIEGYGLRREGNEVLVEVWGTGKPKREFLWVDDLADACVYLMENIDFEDIVKLKGLKGEIRNTHINVGTGEEISIADLADLIKDVVGFGGSIYFNTSKPDGTPRKVTDVSFLHSLGWRHKTPLKEGLELLYRWYIKAQEALV